MVLDKPKPKKLNSVQRRMRAMMRNLKIKLRSLKRRFAIEEKIFNFA